MFFTMMLALMHAPVRAAMASRKEHERLPKMLALPIFSSDALSSIAYATEEILIALLAGAGVVASAPDAAIPVALAIASLLALVAWSYAQTIDAYPQGGGAYLVAKENLGERAGLAAAAALILDYVFTVAASVAAGVAAIASAVLFVGPALARSELAPLRALGVVASALEAHRVLAGVALIAVLTAANLGGMRKTGRLCAAPTYLFIFAIAALVVLGGVKVFTGTLPVVAQPTLDAAQSCGWLLLLRAFASGCSALTGVEAISNCVPHFEAPARRNAKITLAILAVVLAALFVGVTLLAVVLGIRPIEGETVVSQLARTVFGGGALYYIVQVSTLLVLALGANTSFSVFPELTSEIARDGYLPRSLEDETSAVHAKGIVLLGIVSAALLVVFGGEAHALIPLYATGVFASFTLSQAGMVRFWAARRAVVCAAANFVGAVATAAVTLVVAVESIREGAWVVLAAMPALAVVMATIRAARSEAAVARLPRMLPLAR